jgi:hypothetical protein
MRYTLQVQVFLCKGENEMCRTCSTRGEKRNAYKTSVGKPKGKRPLGRPRHRWKVNTKMDLRVGLRMDWIDQNQSWKKGHGRRVQLNIDCELF